MNFSKSIGAGAVAAAAFVLALPAWALSSGESRFLQKAFGGSSAEAELAKLAQSKAMHEEVLEFANRLREDHENAAVEIRSLAAAKGVDLPAAPDKKFDRMSRRLSRLSGPEFEREYMKRMYEEHKDALKDFGKQARSAKDPQVRELASNMALTLHSHLRAAQATRDIAMAGERVASRETGSRRK